MTKILYVGNKLKLKRSNISAIDVLGPQLESEGFIVYYSSTKPKKVIRLLDMMFCVIRYAKELDYVLIDTYSTQNFYYAFLISQLCRLLNLKYIPILHGGNLENRLKHSTKLSRLIFCNSYINVAPSYFMKSIFECYGYTNLKFIPNTIDILKYEYKVRKIDPIKILWVRSFSKIYNPLLAVRMLERLKNKEQNVELCMVGPDSGDGSLNMTQQLAEQLNVSIKFTGKLSKSEWNHLSENYNVFINTTNFDNMPVSVIEAMALGLPIVSTNAGGMPYLIEHETNGLLVNKDDADGFCSAILRLKLNPDFTKTITDNARTKVKEFDWQFAKEKWLEVLKVKE